MLNSFILDISRSGIMNFFRTLLATIDWVVYSIITIFFRTVFNLSNFELTGFYQEFEERVYVILGIFMLFKVTVSILSYLVNPDKISDKEQGVGKIVTRIISVLIMLIALPSVFSLMTEFQNKLLPVIPRIVVGTANTLNSDDITGISDNMALTLFQGFAHKKDECDGDEIGNVSEILNVINEPCSDSNKNIYRYDYLPIISTIVGVLMCYVLFSLCISVAIRAFKMIILRAIAPIPIISYVDPKSSKDGMFATWTKTLFSTWSELFILIAIIYFIVYMIDFLLSGQAWRGLFDGVTNPVEAVFLLAFIIIGLLFFARQVPKFLFDALGIKNRGSFMRMLGMGATALGMGGAFSSSLKARNDYDESHGKLNGLTRARNIGASLFSGLAAGSAAGNAIMSTDKPTFSTGYDAQQKYNATTLSRIHSGSTLGGRMSTRMQTLFLGQSDYDRMTIEKTNYEDANKKLLAYKNTLEKKALEKTNLFIDLDDQHKGINYLEFMSHTEGAKNGNAQSLQWFIDHGWSKQVQDGTKREWDSASHSYVDRPVYKTVAAWQDAQLSLDKIKDKQTQEHGKHLVEAVERYEKDGDNSVFTDFGTEYNDYRLAYDATKDVGISVDFSTYAIAGADASNGDTVGIKQGLGETNKRVTGIVTDPKYKAAEANATATKNSK